MSASTYPYLFATLGEAAHQLPDDIAREALRLGAAKLPVRTKVVTRLDAGIAHTEAAA